MTYSIVARDDTTGQLGVAVQSHWFSVGTLVTWGEAGVGVVATQAMIDPAYGPRGLELMRAGRSAPDALEILVARDPGAEMRQVAMVDAAGRAAAHTGAKCIGAAGGVVIGSAAAQANMMRNDTIWTEMIGAYEAAPGDLAERLLMALEAGERAGGDIRGRQSAAIVIVAAEGTGRAWEDRLFDLRIDDGPDPVGELRRLVRLARAYRSMNAGDQAVERNDEAGALREYARAEEIFPESIEAIFWHAVALWNLGREEDARARFARTFTADPSWRELVPRLETAGILARAQKIIGG